MKRFAIGTDIGGSHISCAAIDLEKQAVLKESFSTRQVDNQAPANTIFEAWANALKETISRIDASQMAGIGFAMPGPFRYDTGIAAFTSEVAKYQSLFGLDVSQCLRSRMALNDNVGFRYFNDATAFAVGEAWLGKASGAKRALAITLGTGFGSAFVEDGIPVVERADVPPMGCVWHLPFDGAIADESFSTRWFIKRYAEKSGHRLAGVKEIADRAGTDAIAKQVFLDFGSNLGRFLAPWLEKFRADVLVIGGNVSSAYNLFGSCLEDCLKREKVRTVVRISELKEDAALIGSARLFQEDFWRDVSPLLPKM